MAVRQIRIGSMADIHQYSDADYDSAIETDHPIKAGPPIDGNDVLRLDDIATKIYPIGTIYLSISATNPGTTLGFGTWVRIAEGQMITGLLALDPDFGTVEGTGGAKTHKHSVDVGSTTSSAPSATTKVISDAAGDDVASSTHTHTVDPASVDSSTVSHLPPFFVIYVWKRTA